MKVIKSVLKQMTIHGVVFFIGFTSVAQNIEGSFESKFKRYQKNESFTGAPTQTWHAVAWKGERINKQIVLWSDTNVNGLSYTTSDLTDGGNSLSASNISLRFGTCILGDPESKGCGEYPTHPIAVEIADGLSTTEVNTISSTDPLKIWLTIDVSEATAVGNYTGTVTVNGGTSPLVFTINVNVVDYTLPAVENWEFHLDLWQFPHTIVNRYNAANPGSPIALWSDAHFDLLEPFYRLLADTGQKAITAHIKHSALGQSSMIEWVRKTDGAWEYDFTAFDKYVESLMSWSITKQISCFSPVGWNETVIPYFDEATGTIINLSATLGSSTYNARWDHFLTAFKVHLDAKGWFDKTVLFLDEVSESKLNNVISVVHGNNSNWKLGIAYSHSLSASTKASFYDLSGFLSNASNSGISADKISTFYTSCSQTQPNNFITPDNNVAEMTWMGWHAFNEGYDGYLRWAYDFWQKSDPFDARDGSHSAGDFSLVYRTSNNSPSEAMSGIRLEMLREGIQDYEKLKIIKQDLLTSSDPYDKEILNELNEVIDVFTKASGAGAEIFVTKGQQVLEEIVLGTFTYCRVENLGTNTDYYVKSLVSTGGDSAINFSTTQYPNFGYEHHATTNITVETEGSFTLNLTNSDASNCARTTVWIDWNNDKDFDDAGEEVFTGGNASCSNSKTYAIPISVPANTEKGEKRIRIQVRDSGEPIPEACGYLDKTGTADFDLEINEVDAYCVSEELFYQGYYINTLSTSGGLSNINFGANGFPLNGYERHTITKLTTEIGASLTLNLANSAESNCARTRVWIDWNNDKDLDDTGELLFDGDAFQSCTNSLSKSINVTVPNDAAIGTTRMRIRLRDAWLANPVPCGAHNYTGTADFDVVIQPTLSANIFLKDNLKLYPNPFNNKLMCNILDVHNDHVDVSIYNLHGVSIYKSKLKVAGKKVEILLDKNLPKGLYVLKIKVDNSIFINKVIKN